MKTFGQHVLDAKIKKNLTLEQVARSAGTHKGYVSGIINGVVNAPSAKILARLCRKLDLDHQTMLALAWWEKRPKALKTEAMVEVLGAVLIEEEGRAAAKAMTEPAKDSAPASAAG